MISRAVPGAMGAFVISSVWFVSGFEGLVALSLWRVAATCEASRRPSGEEFRLFAGVGRRVPCVHAHLSRGGLVGEGA